MISLILLRIIVTPVSLHIIVTYFWISVVLKTWFESTCITTCVYTGLITILLFSFFFFLRFYLLISRQRGREGERDRNIHVWLPLMYPLLGTWPATQACTLTRNRTSDHLVCRPVLSPLIHTSQGNSIFYLLIFRNKTNYHIPGYYFAYGYCYCFLELHF